MHHLRTLVVFAAAASFAAAQSPSDKDQEINDLKKRVQALETAKKDGTAPADSSNTPTWKDLVSLGGHLKWYGFLRLDSHYSDSVFDNPRFPTFVRSEGGGPVPGITAPERNEGNFVMSARLTRLGFDVDSGKIGSLWDASASGKLEIDFFALPSSESRAVPRMRHAYGKVGWTWLNVLFGQTSDLASPLNPSLNPDNVLWNWGNTGDRRPQIRVTSEPMIGDRVKFFFGLMAGQEGAIKNTDVDGLGVQDGDAGAMPKWEARVAVSFQHWVEKKWITLGISYMTGQERVDGAGTTDGRHIHRTDMFAVDFEFPILEQISFKCEYWRGRNLADIRGGIGQSFAPTGQEIRASGGWMELKVSPVKWYAATLGYSRDNPHESDLTTGFRSGNTVYYLMNTFTFDPFLVSFDVGRWASQFVNLHSGRAWRYTLTLQLSF